MYEILIYKNNAKKQNSGSVRVETDSFGALDVPAAARTLGVSEFSIREMIRSKKLRSIRIGRLIRIPARAIEELLQ